MIQPVGMKPSVNTSAITKTAAVGPRLQPEKKPEQDAGELRAQRDTIQNQLTTVKGLVDGGDDKTVKALEGKLEQVNDSLSAVEDGQKPYASALDRIKGKTDLYESEEEPEETELTTVNTDKVDQEIRSLEKQEKQLTTEAKAAEKRGDVRDWERLEKQIKSVQAQAQQKENNRKQDASVSTVLS